MACEVANVPFHFLEDLMNLKDEGLACRHDDPKKAVLLLSKAGKGGCSMIRLSKLSILLLSIFLVNSNRNMLSRYRYCLLFMDIPTHIICCFDSNR